MLFYVGVLLYGRADELLPAPMPSVTRSKQCFGRAMDAYENECSGNVLYLRLTVKIVFFWQPDADKNALNRSRFVAKSTRFGLSVYRLVLNCRIIKD